MIKRLVVLVMIVMFSFVPVCSPISFGGGTKVPKALKSRFVLGDPVWREIPIRDEMRSQYDRVWQTLINTVIEHNYEIATMEKTSGYFRTNWNQKVVVLTGRMYYKVQITVKLIMPTDSPNMVEKVRLQVSGDITQLDKWGGVEYSVVGYDQIVLENLMQDIQSKIGAR